MRKETTQESPQEPCTDISGNEVVKEAERNLQEKTEGEETTSNSDEISVLLPRL